MSERERVAIGTKWGRWEVVKRASPSPRYNEPGMRARVHVRCVCGHEQTVFVNDLQSGKTTGCKKSSCRERWRELAAGGMPVQALPDPQSYSVQKVAELLSCAPCTVRRLIARGKLRSVRVGGLVRVLEHDLRKIIQA